MNDETQITDPLTDWIEERIRSRLDSDPTIYARMNQAQAQGLGFIVVTATPMPRTLGPDARERWERGCDECGAFVPTGTVMPNSRTDFEMLHSTGAVMGIIFAAAFCPSCAEGLGVDVDSLPPREADRHAMHDVQRAVGSDGFQTLFGETFEQAEHFEFGRGE